MHELSTNPCPRFLFSFGPMSAVSGYRMIHQSKACQNMSNQISVVIDGKGDLGRTYNRITQEVLIEIYKPYHQASMLCVSSAVEGRQ